MNTQPIGIFDSGIGGLTVAKAVNKLLPNENIIYFGDTAHLPYGDKSTAAIQSYAIKICDLLLQQKCKIILIACNSASAAAYDLVKEYVGSKAKVMNVIDPVISYLNTKYEGKKIGLIGTQKTVSSKVYPQKIQALKKDIVLKSLATKLLAPMIEEGFFNNNISQQIIENYLSSPLIEDIEALILGCTHYPLIKKEIEAYYNGKIDVIDASDIVANEVQAYLLKHQLQNDSGAVQHNTFYVSDFTTSFEKATQMFFGEKLNLQYYPLWE